MRAVKLRVARGGATRQRFIHLFASVMKSAYELAMERLEKSAPAAKLSEEQRAAIAEIDSRYKARLAEREVFLEAELAKARAAGNAEDWEQVSVQLRRERARIQEECEAQKEKVRAGKA